MNSPTDLAYHSNFADWMSGHVEISTAKKLIGENTTRPVRFFTCLREPVAQVMSHYNWLIEIHSKGGGFYDNHPPAVKAISERIRNSERTIDSIIQNLETFQRLFLNFQSRFILGAAFAGASDEMREMTAQFECISDNSRIPHLIKKMTGKTSSQQIRSNQSRYHFDPGIFSSDQMIDFLRQWNARDEKLFKLCCPNSILDRIAETLRPV